MDCVSSFMDVVNKSLKKGVNEACHLTVDFRTDVFAFLFGNKGRHGKGRLYILDDFDRTDFPRDWQIVHDRLGDGCTVDFPICMYSWVKWSPTVYVPPRCPTSPVEYGCVTGYPDTQLPGGPIRLRNRIVPLVLRRRG